MHADPVVTDGFQNEPDSSSYTDSQAMYLKLAALGVWPFLDGDLVEIPAMIPLGS